MSTQCAQNVHLCMHIYRARQFLQPPQNSVKSACNGFSFHSMVFNSQNGFNSETFAVCFLKVVRKKRRETFEEIKTLFMGWPIKITANVS